jgi:uncharacterized protein
MQNSPHLNLAVNTTERIISLDVLRGIAVLGILIMNIQNFSMPTAAYINPVAYGNLEGINRWVWILSHILASEKFMSTFSILFGAGVLIFTDRMLQKGYNNASLHYRRMGWLLLFGMIHAYVLWSGDILVAYSLCGMLIYLFRNLKPRSLVWISAGFFVIPVIFDTLSALSIPYWPEESVHEIMKHWRPDTEAVQAEIEGMKGGWISQMEYRAGHALFMQTQYFMMATFWRTMSMMLLGMALFKWAILSAGRSSGFYTRMIFIGLGSGYALSVVGVLLNFRNGWTMEYSMFLGAQFNYLGSAGVALGYLAIIMLICRSAHFLRFKKILGAVGRMAFSNYILQSILCVFIFYGTGLGLFGDVERKYQVLIVIAIWSILLVISPLWLDRRRFGPLEWFWRRLTYGRRST